MLNDFFAPLVLEIDIDIRRFAALARDEALEEHVHTRGVHLGDPQAVADGGIGGRAAALAEDSAPARKGDQLGNRQEVGLVL